MKTKNLFFCLLFILLGTATAWADKYYTVGSRVTGELEIGTGKKYMIYNTTFNGAEDRSGFLYNMGTKFGVERFRSVDKMICNEAFVFTLEDAGDDDPHTIYLKSIPGNGYLDVDGVQHTTPVKLNLYTWDEARDGDTYTVSASGVSLTDNNSIKQACVKSLNAGYTVIAEHQINSKSNAVYVIADEDKTWYFNGNTDSYAKWSKGHPYAFYECQELTSLSTFDIQDLHIYSRCDLYSVQKIYGYVQKASQITSNYYYTGEGAIENLFDGDFQTYNNTNWGYNNSDSPHYYQIDLETDVESLRLYMARRSNGNNGPIEYELWASKSEDGEYVEIELGENNNTGLNNSLTYTSPVINLGDTYRYIRIYGTTRTTPDYQCLAFSELYVLPDRVEINDALPYFDNTVPIVASELEYKTLIEKNNKEYAAAKLFSGVPVPGNKYRIYADAYSDGAYVGRDISVVNNADSYSLAANNSYLAAKTAGDASAFEWYCEESSDGKLLFRNVKNPTLYLGCGVVTTDVNSAKWTMNTNLTQRHGVPLKNSAEQYLTVYNTGEQWMGDVKCVQNQTITTGSADIKNTPADTTDDIDLTDSKGLCTDFVFLPVDLTENEICVTIVASDLADRNSKLLVDGVEYEIPFSKVFYNGVPTITLTSTTKGYYNFTGFYNGNSNICTEITNALYTDGTIKSGTKLEARFEIAEGKLPELSGETIKLYRIKNLRSNTSISQQAGMSRANIGYEDDEYTSLEDTKIDYYASFDLKNKPLELIYNENELGATSLFYFTNSNTPDDNEKFCAFINSAVTTLKASKPNEWTNGGVMYYIQPNAVEGETYQGFTIARTMLDADNNPGDAWCSNHANGNIVTEHSAEDGGSAWEFVAVDDEEATEELTKHIQLVTKNLILQLTAKIGTKGIDDDKINKTLENVQSIAGVYNTANDTFDTTNAAITTADVTDLVSYSQKMQVLYNQIEYAFQELPQPTQPTPETEELSSPKWYYVKNVYNSAYAQYNGANKLMKFSDGNSSLSNLFYFTGKTVESDTKNEYVKYVEAHIHNFKALNLKDTDTDKDSTIVSQNEELFTRDITPASGGQQTQIELNTEETLKSNTAWELTLEYNLSNGTFFNGWGSGLLASGTDAAVNNGTYNTGFQVYLQADGDVVIRGGDSGATDNYRFEHTVGAYKTLKVVLSYANKQLQVAVTNSEGVTQTIIDTEYGSKIRRDYIPCEYMTDITNLASAMSSASSFSMKAEVVVSMKWDTHANNVVAGAESDTWYILPSSNTTNLGLAIVSGSPADTEMGWSNVNGEDQEVFNAPGNNDYSTWQFERVTDFTEHIAELLAMYNNDKCVIYNEKLAALYNTLAKHAAGDKNETTFNVMISAIRGYNGPTPDELKAPKPGSLYTIRPIADIEDTKEALLVHVDKQDTYHATTEVYKGTVIDNDGDIDSRAVWMFEGDIDTSDPSGSFLNKSNLKARNIHTQTYLGAPGADATKLAQDGTAIALAPLGACTTSIKVGDTYMQATGDATIAYQMGSRFWGYALDEYPSDLNTLTNGKVHGKSFLVTVETAGTVTVTFTHEGGNHKLNILGVTIYDANGNLLKSDYRHTTAGSNPSTQTYNLGNVEPGTYTIHCYVWNFDGGNEFDKVDFAQGNITIAGISSVASITNTGTENTKWIIEEITEPEEDVCYTTTIEEGYSTIMLGFDAKIPTGIEAYYGINNGFIIDRRYLAMEKYESSILPAQTPVVLRNSNEGETIANAKFYYSKIGGIKEDDYYLNGKLWYTIVPVDEGVNLYMLQQGKEGPKMYWIYEEYNKAGDKVSPDADDGGHVACKANKAYILINNGEAQGNGVFLFSFRPGETTGIDEVKGESGEVKAIYDLTGRRVETITAPGIYIVNGKKVLVK